MTESRNSTKIQLENVLVASLTPYFLGREEVWFEENKTKILNALKTQRWWQDNILFLEQGQLVSLSAIARKLDEMGYEKDLTATSPGEFALRGGTLQVFPVNMKHAVRILLWGNAIESIEALPHITTHENAQALKKRFIKKFRNQEQFSEIDRLKPGDFIVHLDHGVGRYEGKSEIQISESETKEFYVLQYAQGDKLFVPVGLERKLSRYVGFSVPKISRLGSELWVRTKRKIKEETEKLAKELLELYAKREITQRNPIPWHEEFVKEIESSFQYVETEDQLRALSDIREDFQKERPMDRILVGDVGFGKTEVALRAIANAVASGKQTAVLCPTTVLAHQHERTLRSRFATLPVRISCLSRIQSKKEQKKIIEDLRLGTCDIVVGTHRLLSRDVEFANLGLVVVDEEQRFGVKQKEAFKKMREHIDVLSLSATPIPRTLYLALSSMRDISRVQTPPPERVAIETFVLPWSEKTIQQAIRKEIARGGQVYILHNRVETIETARALIQRLAPDARVETAHGKLPDARLVQIMDAFYKKEIDVLVATTIIENGLDVPNVNTLIVEDATRLGLSQAHQIRGRIGRSHIQAYAYFLYGDNLGEEAKKRLEVLREYQALGSGYDIALRDLEMRGAGNILGKEQSGHVNAVGLNLYCQMLADAVEKQRSG